jgi:hypothetical protein
MPLGRRKRRMKISDAAGSISQSNLQRISAELLGSRLFEFLNAERAGI